MVALIAEKGEILKPSCNRGQNLLRKVAFSANFSLILRSINFLLRILALPTPPPTLAQCWVFVSRNVCTQKPTKNNIAWGQGEGGYVP